MADYAPPNTRLSKSLRRTRSGPRPSASLRIPGRAPRGGRRPGEAIRDVKKSLFACSSANTSLSSSLSYWRRPGRAGRRPGIVENPTHHDHRENGRFPRPLSRPARDAGRPLKGIGPEELKLDKLESASRKGGSGVIIATNPTADGESTAHFPAKVLKDTASG